MKPVKRIFIVLIFVLIIINIGLAFSSRFYQLLASVGVVKEEILIAGTGSMYPTFPKGEGKSDIVRAAEIVAWPKMRRYPSGLKIFGKNFFSYDLQHGDIVEMENKETKEISQKKYGEEAGFVKRVIALPEDTIELRDGFVYLNNQLMNEPYTAKPRSTYGGDFLPDCKKLTIPANHFFVLGDNRKASLDSRYELKLVNFNDIHYVIPANEQDEYKKSWRDTQNDSSLAHTATLNEAEFINLLNKKRAEQNLKPLKINSLLADSGKIRASVMIKYDDFSPEATRSGMSLEQAIKESGYRNIIFAEVYTRGFYEAGELLDNFLEFPQTQKILYSDKYQDIGLSAVLGDINTCPVQVVVVHLGGYVPPNYKKEDIDGWQKLIDNLENILPSWESLKQAEGIDKEKVDRLVSLLNTRLSNAKMIVTRMRASQWLDEKEKNLAEEDKNLADEIEKLVAEMNRR